MTKKSPASGCASCSLLPASKATRPEGHGIQVLHFPPVSQSGNEVRPWLLHRGHLVFTTLPPVPLLLLKTQWRSEHRITRMMCPRARSQHGCWWSHSKLGWSVHWLNLPINSLHHQARHGQADKSGSREKGVSCELSRWPAVCPKAKGASPPCPSHFGSSPRAEGKHLAWGLSPAKACLRTAFVLGLPVFRSRIKLLHVSPEGTL